MSGPNHNQADQAHDCATCEPCIHDGRKCCGCYDGACCQSPEWGAYTEPAFEALSIAAFARSSQGKTDPDIADSALRSIERRALHLADQIRGEVSR